MQQGIVPSKWHPTMLVCGDGDESKMTSWKRRSGTKIGQQMLNDISRLYPADRIVVFRVQEAYTSMLDPTRRWKYRNCKTEHWVRQRAKARTRTRMRDRDWVRSNKEVWSLKRHPDPHDETHLRNRDNSAVLSMMNLMYGEEVAQEAGYSFRRQ